MLSHLLLLVFCALGFRCAFFNLFFITKQMTNNGNSGTTKGLNTLLPWMQANVTIETKEKRKEENMIIITDYIIWKQIDQGPLHGERG